MAINMFIVLLMAINVSVNYIRKCGIAPRYKEAYILSPNYPNETPANTLCNYVIQIPKPGKIVYQVQELNMTETTSCSKEGVTIVAGGQVTRFICGSNYDGNKIYTSFHRLIVVFKSSKKRYRRGFKIHYSTYTCDDYP